jgi:hypothetical protein
MVKAKLSCVVGPLAIMLAGTILWAQDSQPQLPKPTKEHEFLKQFVGNWDCVVEAHMEPGKPPTKSTSTLSGQMIGNLWAVVVVKGDAAGIPYHGQGMYGYDSKKNRFVGTWADSMSEHMWQYDGTLDGNALVLHSEGPLPTDPGKMIKARDTWTFKNSDTLVLTGQMEGPDGKFITMMTATCTRRK